MPPVVLPCSPPLSPVRFYSARSCWGSRTRSSRTYAARRFSAARHRSLGRCNAPGVTPPCCSLRPRASLSYAGQAPSPASGKKDSPFRPETRLQRREAGRTVRACRGEGEKTQDTFLATHDSLVLSSRRRRRIEGRTASALSASFDTRNCVSLLRMRYPRATQ